MRGIQTRLVNKITRTLSEPTLFMSVFQPARQYRVWRSTESSFSRIRQKGSIVKTQYTPNSKAGNGNPGRALDGQVRIQQLTTKNITLKKYQ